VPPDSNASSNATGETSLKDVRRVNLGIFDRILLK
jgi:hypothetical protein